MDTLDTFAGSIAFGSGPDSRFSLRNRVAFPKFSARRACGALAIVVGFFISVLAAPQLHAQSGLEDTLFTAATVTTDSTGRNWAYLVWDATRMNLINGKAFAVYAKPGQPSTPGDYQRRAIVSLQINPTVLQPLLSRAVNLGENLTELSDVVNHLFQTVSNISTRPLPEKLSLVIQGAAADPVLDTNVRLLARLHPGVNLCLGTSHAELIPAGDTTFELREIDPATKLERSVVGRVTVTAGAPTVLPAPSAPVQVVEPTPKGDLNIKLRWATPPALRRLSLLSYGFNVWRMTRTFAEANNYQNNPPGPATFRALAQLNPNELRQLNRAPVLKSKDFDPGAVSGQVGDFTSPAADPATYFFADDNGRFDPGGVPFLDGQQFYYFVAARDLLGRDGQISPGTLATACRRIPPFAPRELAVENEYNNLNPPVTRQELRLTWRQVTNTGADAVTHYLLYRWTNTALIQTNTDLPQRNYIGFVAHNPAAVTATFLDNTLGSPHMPDDAGKTFWYTVRAANSNACLGTGLLSPNSSPAYGVLRDRVGPDAPTGFLEVNCVAPVAAPVFFTKILSDDTDPFKYHYVAACSRADPGIAWVEFVVTNSFGDIQTLGRHYFAAGYDEIRVPYTWPTVSPGAPFALTCTVGSFEGKVSAPSTVVFSFFPASATEARYDLFTATLADSDAPPTHGTPPAPGARATIQRNAVTGRIQIRFPGVTSGTCLIQASTDLNRWVDVATVTASLGTLSFVDLPSLSQPYRFYRGVPVNTATNGGCTHVARSPGSSQVHGIRIGVLLRPKTASYKIYRRVDEGPLTLIAQGAATYNAAQPLVTRTDDAMPPTGAIVCYYAQLFDVNGNASPLAQIGDCTPVTGPLPVPLLSPPEAVGDASDPQMKLRWYCPPAGVERFRITVAGPPPGSGGGLKTLNALKLLAASGEPNAIHYVAQPKSALATKLELVSINGATLAKLLSSEVTFTPRVGGIDLGPGPNFEMTLRVALNTDYTVFIDAVNGKNSSLDSSAYPFTWKYRPPGPSVPWPARPLPAPVSSTDAGFGLVKARVLTNQADAFSDPVFGGDIRHPVGVRIGERLERDDGFQVLGASPFKIHPDASHGDQPDPNSYVYRSNIVQRAGTGQSLLPAMLYRVQVSNAFFPRVSGDVTQVSPLLEKIAWVRTNDANFQAEGLVIDPFVAAYYESELRPGFRGSVFVNSFYLVDTQPVLRGGRYRYLLMRLGGDGEINKVINAGEVDIPRSGGFR